ncbi:hypothetical protein MTO96_042964 [Rhipicephalus appendiculatus]
MDVTNGLAFLFRIVHVHSTCFRSQKKTGRPYNVQLSFNAATGVPRTTACECPAGKSGACSHVLAAVRLLALLKQQGFAEPPPALACTELPQQWRRPRQKGIKPASVQDVDWRAPREGGVQLPLTARLSDASADYQDEGSQVAAIRSLGAELEALGDLAFAAVLQDVQAPLIKTKAGLAPADSPLTYQQSGRPHNFKVWMATVAPGLAVNPAFPWLGASPDRFVYDPEELTYGVLEIKCPYSLKDSQPEEARSKKFCIIFEENDEPQLDRDHEYYAQVLGQMGVTGCRWADFVVCSENWIAIERIRFDKIEWLSMRKKLDKFFFEHMLPYMSSKH